MFQSAQSQQQHSHTPCIRACFVRACRRHRPAPDLPPLECDHITTSEQQWKALFKLKYPDLAVPDVLDEQNLSLAEGGVGDLTDPSFGIWDSSFSDSLFEDMLTLNDVFTSDEVGPEAPADERASSLVQFHSSNPDQCISDKPLDAQDSLEGSAIRGGNDGIANA